MNFGTNTYLDNTLGDGNDGHEMLPEIPMATMGDDGEPTQDYQPVERLLGGLLLQQDLPPALEGEC